MKGNVSPCLFNLLPGSEVINIKTLHNNSDNSGPLQACPLWQFLNDPLVTVFTQGHNLLCNLADIFSHNRCFLQI